MTQSTGSRQSSETTGSALQAQRAQSSIGPQLGEIEFALSKIEEAKGHAHPDLVHRIKPSLTELLRQPLSTKGERDMVEQIAAALQKPVTPTWCQGRIVVTLSHYFVAQLEKQQVEAVFDDWFHELREFPAWAISNACRWWLSRKNEKRRVKPMPGDIGARARLELGIVKLAEGAVGRYDRGVRPEEPEPPRKPLTPEEIERRRQFSAEIMGKLGRDMKPKPPQSEAETQRNIDAAKQMLEGEKDE